MTSPRIRIKLTTSTFHIHSRSPPRIHLWIAANNVSLASISHPSLNTLIRARTRWTSPTAVLPDSNTPQESDVKSPGREGRFTPRPVRRRGLDDCIRSTDVSGINPGGFAGDKGRRLAAVRLHLDNRLVQPSEDGSAILVAYRQYRTGWGDLDDFLNTQDLP